MKNKSFQRLSETTLYEVRDNIAIITLNSPPVNGLGQTVRQGIKASFEIPTKNDEVKAIIVTSSGKLFFGG